MGEGHSLVGAVVIVVLYASIGLMAVTGAVVTARRIFGPRGEQVSYGIFLVLIAAFYLAFTAYFGVATARRVETAAVLAFGVIGVLGTRVAGALIAGYALHGVWDMVHELEAHGAYAPFEPGQLTMIPLAYGIFCLAFDVGMAGYAWWRRSTWDAAWSGQRR